MADALSSTTQIVLPNRGILRLSGEDRVGFLQGLVSNDVTLVAPDRAVYACLLTPQGKFLHDFFLVADGDAILIECEAARRDDLLRRLKTFKLRSKVEIADATAQFEVAVPSPGAVSGLPAGARSLLSLRVGVATAGVSGSVFEHAAEASAATRVTAYAHKRNCWRIIARQALSSAAR